MIISIYVISFFIGLFIIYHVIRYRNPYKLYMVFGKKGAGKSTMMAKIAYKMSKKGFLVFSNSEIPGTYYFNTDLIGIAQFPPNSVILVDEVGLIWHKRDFKSFSPAVRKYFKLQRKYRHIVYLFSQSFDVDASIRELADYLFLVKNIFNCFSIARRISKYPDVIEASKSVSGESKIVDSYRIDSLLLFWCGSVRVTYIPRWVRLFNSFDPPELENHYKQMDYVEPLPILPFWKRVILFFYSFPSIIRSAWAAAPAWAAQLFRRKKKVQRSLPAPLDDEII